MFEMQQQKLSERVANNTLRGLKVVSERGSAAATKECRTASVID